MRRNAIHTNYRAVLDILPAGGYGTLYGPNVTNAGAVTASEGKIPGWEYLTYADDGTGRKNVTQTESNAWREVRVRMTYPALGAPLAIGCSTDNFAIRPAALGMAVTDSDWQTAGIARTLNNAAFPGGTVHKARQPFTGVADHGYMRTVRAPRLAGASSLFARS